MRRGGIDAEEPRARLAEDDHQGIAQDVSLSRIAAGTLYAVEQANRLARGLSKSCLAMVRATSAHC